MELAFYQTINSGSPPAMAKERIHKVIAHAGVTSRRKAEQLIKEGRVIVDGEVISRPGLCVDPEKSTITIDGKCIVPAHERIYILLNKPRGYITSLHDPEERPTVIDLLKHVTVRVYPVGRLDYDAEGLLLLTNDGALANRMLHPRYGVPRTYLVKVKGIPSPEAIKKLRSGVLLSDGMTVPAQVTFPERISKNSWVRVTVTEGRNNLIKRMFEKVGHRVLKLQRIRFGSLGLGDLRSGEYRVLLPAEVKKLV